MDSEFNSESFVDEVQDHEIVLGASERFVFSKKRIYGRMHFLKRPSEKYKNDLIAIESLRKEFAIGYSLDHPNIAKYHRFENDTLFEEYIDGKSLRELIDGNDPRLSDKHFLQSLCLQFLDVLRYLREMGVVHNDIKPENVLVTRIGNTLKLIDFNCAQTSDNDILGGYSIPYKSPEQGRGDVDCSSDLFQVGKLMELLSCRIGNSNRWKRFIEGTTAFNPAKRISLERAEKLIPGEYKIKNISLTILLLIIITIGILSIFLIPRKHIESIAPEPRRQVKDTVVIENVKQPAEEPELVPEKHVPGPVDVKKVIEKKISDYADTYYKTNLYPVCREALENGDRRLTADEETELQKAIDKAYRSAMDYGVKLSIQYPEERNYIEKECLQSFEMKISALLLKLYPPASTLTSETGE